MSSRQIEMQLRIELSLKVKKKNLNEKVQQLNNHDLDLMIASIGCIPGFLTAS